MSRFTCNSQTIITLADLFYSNNTGAADEKQAFYFKWLSKDMNEHDQYMADFMQVYQPLDRWGTVAAAGLS